MKQKKRHIPKKCRTLRLRQRCKKHKQAECAVQYIHGHTECKNFLQYAYFEFAVQSSTFTISLPNFLFSDLFCCFTSNYVFRNAPLHFKLVVIYTVEKQNASAKRKKLEFLGNFDELYPLISVTSLSLALTNNSSINDRRPYQTENFPGTYSKHTEKQRILRSLFVLCLGDDLL